MKKLIGLIIALTLGISVCVCGSETETQEVTQEQIEENIIGSWIVADRKGRPALTNEKGVFTFISPTRAYVSASFNARPELDSHWIDLSEAEVDITGSKVTLTRPVNENTIMVDELSISNINDTEKQGSLIVKSIEDGEETIITEEPIRLVKVNDDYSEEILGTWEGHCTSEDSVFDDGQEHRWEFKDDGTYVYYVKDGDNWITTEDALGDYFVAGNLLCGRWLKGETENREWWEITIDGDTMNWTALREGEDGNTFTATFEMTKVVD